MRRIVLRCLLVAGMMAGLASSGGRAQEAQLGTIDFPTSGSGAAQQHFLDGVKYLHSFEFDEAAEAFVEAQKLDPNFALAYWGEAMSHNHPLWAQQDVGAARKVLARLGATKAARIAKAPTPREKGYLEAIEILYGDGDKLARDIAYAEAMGRLSEQFPQDREAAALYALAILGTMRPGEPNYRKQMQAGAIVQEIFRENPNHPGAAHYLIHSFDDPIHAPLALRAARLYASIAPAAPHALHMPSHIFVQRGMWKDVAASNQASYAASVDWVSRKNLSAARRDFHSLSWLQYAYLQLGDYAKANETIEMVRPVVAQSDGSRVRGSLNSMQARYIVETGEWRSLPIAPPPAGASGGRAAAGMESAGGYGGDASVLLAAGMSAAKMGDLAAAEQAEAALTAARKQREASTNPYSAKPIAIMEKEVAALVRSAKGDKTQALQLLKEATAIEETMDPPSGPPDPIKPSHELYGEILLEMEQPKEAYAQFSMALERMPNRTQALLGAARAAAKMGDRPLARRHYNELAKIWSDSSLPALQEARRFLSESD